MLTLLLSGTLLDSATERSYLLLTHPNAGLGYLLCLGVYVLASSFTVLNMLIGVLCEVVAQTAAREGESTLVEQVSEEVVDVYDRIDDDGNGKVSRVEYDELIQDPVAIRSFAQVDLAPKHLHALSDVLFAPEEEEHVPWEAPVETPSLRRKNTFAPKRSPTRSTRLLGNSRSTRATEVSGRGPTLVRAPTVVKAGRLGIQVESVEHKLGKLLELLVHMRPGKNASVVDVCKVKKMVRSMSRRISRRLEVIMERRWDTEQKSKSMPDYILEFDQVLLRAETELRIADGQ